MCLTIEDGLLSLLTTLSFHYDPTDFADKMSKYGLIPDEVKYDVHRLYKTGKLTDHHLKCRILQAVKDFISTNEIENIPQVIMLLKRKLYIGIEAKFMKDYLCKLLCVREKGMGLIYNVYSTTSTNSTGISISSVTNH